MPWLAIVARFIVAFVGVFLGLYLLLALVVLVSGGTLIECDRADCGTVGDWWYSHSHLVFALVLALALVFASFVALRHFRQRL
jgi:hypothetical protein